MEENSVQVADDYYKKDFLLDTLVYMLNQQEGVEIGITLNVRGTIVSGLLVGYKTFLKGKAEMFRSIQTNQEFGEVLAGFFDTASENYEKGKTDSEESGKDLQPNFIHLKNAKFYDSNGTLPNEGEGFWWRGKLSDVSGFTLGNFSPK
ncbi:hypothetical protein M3221_13590 [Domibacillus indicus]|uniref:gas vesicle accessory protein GvpU n=1 Tax=Domibacillus indicus TaxID=1437523 RepID=UPI00203CD98E|nr:gas vesicle accessory protein GvpU [Domibacillus indicus]MCM3789433.1 hypothetical protein [Domibacillus indicus]